MSATAPLWKRLFESLRSQWLATTLIIPLILLGVSTHIAHQDAKEARIQAARVDRVAKLQESGKALDLALAAYFQSVADAGLAERHLTMPGAYEQLPVQKAEKAVVQARVSAREALVKHASDVQALRGTLDQKRADEYMHALAEMSSTIDQPADINNTGSNITVLSKLVVQRNKLVDTAMHDIG